MKYIRHRHLEAWKLLIFGLLRGYNLVTDDGKHIRLVKHERTRVVD